MISCAPRLFTIVEQLSAWAKKAPQQVPEGMKVLLDKTTEALAYMNEGID